MKKPSRLAGLSDSAPASGLDGRLLLTRRRSEPPSGT
jgi:hypothetical protein